MNGGRGGEGSYAGGYGGGGGAYNWNTCGGGGGGYSGGGGGGGGTVVVVVAGVSVALLPALIAGIVMMNSAKGCDSIGSLLFMAARISLIQLATYLTVE